jgi:hypothetical protein
MVFGVEYKDLVVRVTDQLRFAVHSEESRILPT